MAQLLKQVDPATEEMIVTARVILSAALDPQTPLSVPAIALRTGLTVEVVREVMNSQTYQLLFSDQLRMLVSGTMVRGITRLDKIINSDKTTDANVIAAVRATVHFFEACRLEPQRPDEDSDKVDKLMGVLKKIADERSTS